MLFAASLLIVARSPRSGNPLARAHGRVDAAVTALLVLLVVMTSFVESLSPTLYIAVVCIVSAAQLYGYLYYLPYHLPAMNQLKVACASVLLWASLCMGMAQLHDAPEVRGRAPGVGL
jgi:hypothetical protein